MRRGYLTPPVIIILALITFGVALTLFFNTNLLKNIKNQPPEPSIQPQPSPTPAPTISSFKSPTPIAYIASKQETYTSDSFKFAITYPKGTYVQRIPNYSSYKYPLDLFGGNGNIPRELELQSDKLDPNSPEVQAGNYTHGKGFYIRFKAQKILQDKKLIDIIKENYKKCLKEEYFKSVKIGNYDAFFVGSCGLDQYYYLQNEDIVYEISIYYVYDELTHGKNYQAEEEKGLKEIDQILSTFRFLD